MMRVTRKCGKREMAFVELNDESPNKEQVKYKAV